MEEEANCQILKSYIIVWNDTNSKFLEKNSNYILVTEKTTQFETHDETISRKSSNVIVSFLWPDKINGILE